MTRFVPVFFASFFLSLHFGIILYVNSSLLSKFFEPATISLLFLIGALGNIILFLFVSKLIERLGKRSLLLILLALTMLSTLGLSLTVAKSMIAIFFIIYTSLIYIIFYCLDIFLEDLSLDTLTGEIRGAYIALIHLGIMFGLLILTLLTIGDAFKIIYMTASVLLIFPILITLFFLKYPIPKERKPHNYQTLLSFRSWWQTKDIRYVTIVRLSLELFYTFMIIYTPLYLYNVLGFTWSTIGVMFIIMLVPFIFQWSVGKLADYFIGEKKLMMMGFLIMGIALLLMPYLGTSIINWTVVLFLSRVGASLVETTSDSYFFKHIVSDDTGFLSIFRLTRPVSVVLGTAVGAMALYFFSFENIFFILAVIIFFGLKESLSLRDTL